MNPAIENHSELSEAVAEARNAAKEQVAAAWQMQIDRIREQLDSGWRESLDHIFGDRFGDIDGRLQKTFAAAVADSRKRTTEKLNSLARRLRNAESRDEAIRTVLDAAAELASRAALFSVTPKG